MKTGRLFAAALFAITMADATASAQGFFAEQARGAKPGNIGRGAPLKGPSADALYDSARSMIEQGRYDRAIDAFDRVINLGTGPTDAAMYWKAYSLSRLTRAADALNTLAELQRQFPESRWLRDARALDVEVRQASGQPVASVAQGDDEELKLLALRGLMQSDPDKTLPIIEKMLAGNDAPRVKDRALFVISQSGSPRAREIIINVAKSGNPDLQLKAIRYLGMFGDTPGRQALDDIYRSSADPAVKRAIIRSYMVSSSRDRLLAIAKSEPAPELRGDAIQQLGVIGAVSELEELYRVETDVQIKRRILQGLFVAGRTETMSTIARTETNPELRRLAIRNLGLSGKPGSAETLTGIYASAGSDEVRRAVIEALFLQSNAKALVDLARAEKSPDMRKAIVGRLSLMRSPEATAYMMELLK